MNMPLAGQGKKSVDELMAPMDSWGAAVCADIMLFDLRLSVGNHVEHIAIKPR